MTAADREVERIIRDYVMERYPHAEFFGEETGRHGDNAATASSSLAIIRNWNPTLHAVPTAPG